MGKQLKKGRNPRKPQHHRSPRSPAVSSPSISETSNRKAEVGDEGVKDANNCNHWTKGSAELSRVLLEIGSSLEDVVRCEACREETTKKRGNKERGKQSKKRAGSKTQNGVSDSELIWVCLYCNGCHCAGLVSDTGPYGHARSHAKAEHHSWAVRFDNPSICWCFQCSSLVPIEMPQRMDGDKKSAMDVENVGFGGNVDQEKGTENRSERGYAVGGLVNLGNTCFFNSVMQNLLATNVLRECLISSDQTFGPLTMALKKLFIETGASRHSRGVLSPKALFGCICSKASQFRGYQQQDSHELLRCFLDGLQAEEVSARKSSVSPDGQDKGSSNPERTFVDAIFGGQLSSTVSCVECGHTSTVYEPFLDLSLPVPSKKPPPKKAPISTPKRNKLAMREVNRSRKVQGKGIAKVSPSIEQQKTGTSSSPSECNVSGVPTSEQRDTPVTETEDNPMWLDFVEPSVIHDTADSVSQKCEVSIAQCSDSGQICEGENDVQGASDYRVDMFLKEKIAYSDSCEVSTCRDENPSSCTQDSAVLLMPDKALDSTVEDINRVTQTLEKASSIGSLLKESSAQTTSVAGCEQVEIEFDGFGDLFNEPEVTSDLKRETGTVEEMDTTLWTDNSKESNQDEVDTSGSLVSVDSCLALFTKCELLSNEHAWNCERCSHRSPHQNAECRRGKRQAIARHDKLEFQTKSNSDGVEVRSKKPSPSIEADFVQSTGLGVLDNGNMITNSKDIDLHTEIKESLEIPDDLKKGEDFSESDHASQYQSCPSALEASILQRKSGKPDTDSCSTNDTNSFGCGGQNFAAVYSGSPNRIETVHQSSFENDSFSEVNQDGREGSQLLGKIHPENDSESEKMETENRKVTRDATKRFLISRVPSVLTIHLKRFNQDDRGRLTKLRGHVSFREILDMRPYMDPRCRDVERCSYRLVGVVEHSGGMSGGHYIAYVKGEGSRESSWFYASDAYVREVSFSEVLRAEAYILFYEKV